MDHLKKLELDEKEALKQIRTGRISRVIYSIVFFISLFLIFVAGSGIVLCVFSFFMIGVSQSNYNKGKKLQALIQNYKLYAEKLQGKQKVTVDDLSACVSQASKVVTSNLNEMIQRGYIIKVVEGADYYRYAYIQDAAIQLPDDGRIIVVVNCDACGGVNRIPKDKTGVCEYCGSEIHS